LGHDEERVWRGVSIRESGQVRGSFWKALGSRFEKTVGELPSKLALEPGKRGPSRSRCRWGKELAERSTPRDRCRGRY